MRGREVFSTSPASPTTKSVPILRPSRPSRAISTASLTVCSKTCVSTPRRSLQISLNRSFLSPNAKTSSGAAARVPFWFVCVEPHLKARLSRGGVHPDLTAVPGGDALTQPRPFADALGSEERLEGAVLISRGMPGPSSAIFANTCSSHVAVPRRTRARPPTIHPGRRPPQTALACSPPTPHSLNRILKNCPTLQIRASPSTQKAQL